MDSRATPAKAWLISRTGPGAGVRHPVAEGVTRLGRSPDNEIVIEGVAAATVSGHHLEIVRDAEGVRIRDLQSTNGTLLNGSPLTEAELTPSSVIQLGSKGPEFSFEVEEVAAVLDRTVMVPREAPEQPKGGPAELGTTYDGLLSDAVAKARTARARGRSNETIMIMRETLRHALSRSRRGSRRVIAVLAAALVLVAGLAWWKIRDLQSQKSAIDARIREIETRLEKAAASGQDTDELIQELNLYEGEAQQLQGRLLFGVAARAQEDPVKREIRFLMAEFGAEVYSVPPEFTERIKHYLNHYQTTERPILEHALAAGKDRLQTVQRILAEEQLPTDLAYIPIVESALQGGTSSPAGAAGPWQFTPATARAYGLRVDGPVDERHDLVKSTRAGCRYLRDLILDFGSGSSVMLALAAYNSGPAKVKQAVSRTVRDPIKQRSFWYLYRVRALPPETREYVPKVVAMMIIGRNPRRFGFGD